MLELFFVSLYFYICSNGLKGQEALYERSLSEAVIEKLAEDRNILAPDIKNLLGIPSKTSNATNTFLHANKHNLIFKQINGVDKCPGKLNYFCEQLTGDNLYQVNNEVREFKNEKNGPQLINISFTINKTGETVILPWFEVKGAPVNELGEIK
ncbi:MAG: hypothetical protein R3D66_01900 [Alphaproteobacteria bacterium]